MVLDKGFIGIEKIYGRIIFEIPFKSSKNKPLDFLERTYFWLQSKIRVVIEHTINKLKRYKIIKDVYRNRKGIYYKIFEIVAGIVNMKILNKMALNTG